MIVKRVINKLFTSNTWVLEFEAFVWLVDCGDLGPIVSNFGNKPLGGVLLTHSHFDHIYGLNDLQKRFPNALIYTNNSGRELLTDDKKNLSYFHETPYVFEHPKCIRFVDEGDGIALDESVTAQVFATPGHNDSCLTLVIDKAVFTGDAYIPGIKVVTTLPGGKKAIAKQSVERILEFSQGKTIYPGHGDIVQLFE